MSHKRKWSYSRVGLGIRRFKREFNRYPVSRDFDLAEYLPSSKYVQRNFGGLIELRKKLKIGSKDFSRGYYSSNRARGVKKITLQLHQKLRTLLLRHQNLSRSIKIEECTPLQTNRATLDFKLSNEAQNCVIEGVYAKDGRTLIGCIHNRITKYRKYGIETNSVYLVSMNTSIAQKMIDESIKRQKKIHQVSIKIYIYSYSKFKELLRGGLESLIEA